MGAAAARPDVAAMTMRSRVREAEALLDPAGLACSPCCPGLARGVHRRSVMALTKPTWRSGANAHVSGSE